MRKPLWILAMLLLLQCCSQKEEQLILGKWKVEEYWVSGNKHASDRYIEFRSDGEYTSFGEELSEVKGEWRIKKDVLILYQRELTDMHGNRVADSFSRIWKVSLAPEWLVMEGTPKSQTQDMKLVLRKQGNP